MTEVVALILAAGKGTRMKSRLVKVLHPLAGRPLIRYVVDAVRELKVTRRLIVVGYQHDRVREALKGEELTFIHQVEQLGTGHAVRVAAQALRDFQGTLLVLSGDTPLLTPETLTHLLQHHRSSGAEMSLLTAILDRPAGYGRVVRGPDGQVERIVEEKDASPAERALTEVNTGTYCFQTPPLFSLLDRLGAENRQGEYYLTDGVALFRKAGYRVSALVAADPTQVLGINDRVQLAQTERILRQRIRERNMLQGVTLIHPDSIFIDAEVTIGPDTVLYPGVILEGRSTIGRETVIGPFSWIIDSQIANGAVLRGWNYLHRASIPSRAILQPFTSHASE